MVLEKNINQKGVIIISGYNNRGIIAFSRFCKDNNILFFIIASGENDLIFCSDYKKNVIGIRSSNKLTVEKLIQFRQKVINENNISDLVILPSTEFLNRFLLRKRKELEMNGFFIPLCSRELYEQLSDKYNFGELCKKYNIKTPREFESVESIEIPFVAKPRKYFSKQESVNEKPILIMNESKFELLKKKDLRNFYFQEFLSGKSFYLLFYFSKDGSYSVFSQENLIQQYNGLSIIAAKSTDIHLGKVSSEYASLFLGIGFTGIIMIEVKFFNGQFYMIEANPRLWGPSQLILDSGMDLFDRFAYDNELIKQLPKRVYQLGKKYFWSGGIIEDQENKHATKFHNYKKELFFDEYSTWCKADVYLRPDTLKIYYKELKK